MKKKQYGVRTDPMVSNAINVFFSKPIIIINYIFWLHIHAIKIHKFIKYQKDRGNSGSAA